MTLRDRYERLTRSYETAQTDLAVMRQVLELSRAYLGKAVADGLMQDCSRPPQFALDAIESALAPDAGQVLRARVQALEELANTVLVALSVAEIPENVKRAFCEALSACGLKERP